MSVYEYCSPCPACEAPFGPCRTQPAVGVFVPVEDPERSCAARERARVVRLIEYVREKYEEVVANSKNQQDRITSIVSRETCMQLLRLVKDGNAFGGAD